MAHLGSQLPSWFTSSGLPFNQIHFHWHLKNAHKNKSLHISISKSQEPSINSSTTGRGHRHGRCQCGPGTQEALEVAAGDVEGALHGWAVHRGAILHGRHLVLLGQTGVGKCPNFSHHPTMGIFHLQQIPSDGQKAPSKWDINPRPCQRCGFWRNPAPPKGLKAYINCRENHG